jgi:hypothetical protein
LNCREICNRRPDLFGQRCTTLRRAVQNKAQWFKKLKQSEPAGYWKIVAGSRSEQEPSSDDAKGEESACLHQQSVAEAR